MSLQPIQVVVFASTQSPERESSLLDTGTSNLGFYTASVIAFGGGAPDCEALSNWIVYEDNVFDCKSADRNDILIGFEILHSR